MNDTAPAGMGHNQPDLKTRLESAYGDVLRRAANLVDSCHRSPEINDDETAEKVSDLLKQVRLCKGHLETAKKEETGPLNATLALVRGIFKKPQDALDAAAGPVKDRHEAYLQKKKRAAEEEARAKAAEEKRRAEEAMRAAEEADRKRREAEEARLRAEREAAEAQQRRLEAEARVKQERERAAAAEQERRRLDAERKKRAERDEMREKAEQEQLERLKKEKEAADARAAEQRAEAAKALEERRRAETESRMAATVEREATRSTNLAIGDAEQAERAANKALAKSKIGSGLGRVRSEYGTVGTLAKRWVYEINDADRIPLEMLRPYINPDAVSAALTRAVQAGVRDIPGVSIYQTEEGRVL